MNKFNKELDIFDFSNIHFQAHVASNLPCLSPPFWLSKTSATIWNKGAWHCWLCQQPIKARQSSHCIEFSKLHWEANLPPPFIHKYSHELLYAWSNCFWLTCQQLQLAYHKPTSIPLCRIFLALCEPNLPPPPSLPLPYLYSQLRLSWEANLLANQGSQ